MKRICRRAIGSLCAYWRGRQASAGMTAGARSRRRSTGSPAAGRINCALHSFRNKKGIASCQREIMPSGMHVEPEELDTFLLILCNSDLDAVKREIKKRLG